MSTTAASEYLRHNRDRLAIEEAETDVRLEIVKGHRRQFEHILTVYLERIMMSSASQKSSLFEILTGSPTAAAAAIAGAATISPRRRAAGGGGGGGGRPHSISPPSARAQERAQTSFSSPRVTTPNTAETGHLADMMVDARRDSSIFASSSRSPERVFQPPSASLTGATAASRARQVEPQQQQQLRPSTARQFSSSSSSHPLNSGGRSRQGATTPRTVRSPRLAPGSGGGNRASSRDRVQVTRLFAGASAKSLGRMARVIPMEIPNDSDTRRKQAVYRRLRLDMAAEEGNLQDFQAAERKRREAYELSRELLFQRTEEKSLRDRLRYDLAMKRRPPEVGLEKAVASDAKLMRVEERKRQRDVALQAVADSRRQIWSRSAQEVDWAKKVFLDKQRDVQARANIIVLNTEEQRRRTDADLNDISIVANVHRRSHRAEALQRRSRIQSENAKLLNLSRAVTERNFESTGITVQTTWEEERPPMPPTGRAAAAAAMLGATSPSSSVGVGAACAVKEISDATYDKLCGAPSAPIPKFAGATEALKHMSSAAWDAMSDLQHDARLRALEFARFHSAGKMPAVAWK